MSITYGRAPRSLSGSATRHALARRAIFATVAVGAEQQRLVRAVRPSTMRSPSKTPSTAPRARIAIGTADVSPEQAHALLQVLLRPYSVLDRTHGLAFANEDEYARSAGFEPSVPPSISRPRLQRALSSAAHPNSRRRASTPRWATCA